MVEIVRNAPNLERAYAYVKALIFDAKVKPGEFINVDLVMDRLDISRQPVRDAINRLAAEGFVRVIPQVGCVVPTLGTNEIRDFFEIFASFEGRMAAFAADRRTAGQIVELRGVNARMLRLVGADPGIAREKVGPPFRKLNRDFHAGLHAMAASPTVGRIAATLLDRYQFSITVAVGPSIHAVFPEESHREHGEVISAVAARDSQGAGTSMERHVRSSVDRILAAAHGARNP